MGSAPPAHPTATPRPSPTLYAPRGPAVVMATPTPAPFPSHGNGRSYIRGHPYATHMAAPIMANPASTPRPPPPSSHRLCLTSNPSPPHDHHPDPVLTPLGGGRGYQCPPCAALWCGPIQTGAGAGEALPRALQTAGAAGAAAWERRGDPHQEAQRPPKALTPQQAVRGGPGMGGGGPGFLGRGALEGVVCEVSQVLNGGLFGVSLTAGRWVCGT